MKLDSGHLEAFYALAKTRNFTKAAKALFISQSAFSQRIKAFETRLGSTLFIRSKKDARLSELGLRILRYCQTQEALESEILSSLISPDKGLSLQGTVRVGASSSHMRSLVLPSLKSIASKNSKVHFVFLTRQIENLREMLLSGEVDFILVDEIPSRNEIMSQTLGLEEFVMIRSKSNHSRSDIYLGTELTDQTMSRFRALQPEKKRAGLEEYSFVGDVYSILDAVNLGYGSAITSKHTIPKNSDIEIDSRFKNMKLPIVLSYLSQPFYTQLHQAVLKNFQTEVSKILSQEK